MRRRGSRVGARLRSGGWSVLQASVAAVAAYSFAEIVLGHEQPFFAPVAAVVAVSVSVGQRGRRGAEIVIGVAIGLIVADLVAIGLGTGPLRMGLVVALAMAAAIAAGGGMLLVNQAAIAALLVVTLQPDEAGFDVSRLLDAGVGAAVAFAVNTLLPHEPRRLVATAARRLYGELAGALEAIAEALERGDDPAAQRAVERCRRLDGATREFRETLTAVSETVALRTLRGARNRSLEPAALAAARAELIGADTRGLARAVSNAVRAGATGPPEAVRALRSLAAGARCLVEMLAGELDDPEPVRERALAAATAAMAALTERPTLATGVLAGQVRSTAVDLLASSGLEHDEAIRHLEEVAGRAAELPLPAAPNE